VKNRSPIQEGTKGGPFRCRGLTWLKREGKKKDLNCGEKRKGEARLQGRTKKKPIIILC